MYSVLGIALFIILLSCTEPMRQGVLQPPIYAGQVPEGMVYVPGGEFTMGIGHGLGYPQESPAHQVKIDPFFMDATEVSNAEFAIFVEATGYITLAERAITWEELQRQLPEGTPKPSEEYLQPGALVFTPPQSPVSLADPSQWWSWVAGASWRNPFGPGSDIADKGDHPVVCVAYEDALAYCQWVGKRLPTEAEWEFAAKGGSEGKNYSWGDQLMVDGRHMANTFQGNFPNLNVPSDGYVLTAPVVSYSPNAYGLYNLIGNVWEWTSDWYDERVFRQRSNGKLIENPTGAESSFDTTDPYTPKRVIKGGSYLCATNYCMNYRSSARIGSADDTGMSHIGFRCVKEIGK